MIALARFPKRISSQLGRFQSGKLICGKLWSDRWSRGGYQFIAQVDFLLRGQKGPVPCAFMLPCPPTCAPFPCHAWLRSMFFHLHTPICSIPACASAMPRHMFSWVSATLLGCAFVPPSGSGSGPSAEPSLEADIMLCFLARAFTQGVTNGNHAN